MSSLRDLVYNHNHAKALLESIISTDESGEKVQQINIPIFYEKICNGCFMKIIMHDGLCNRNNTFLIDDHDLNIDSFLIQMGRFVLDDKSIDGHDRFNFSTPVLESGGSHYLRATLFDGEVDLPVEVKKFIEELRNPSKMPGNDYVS